LNIFALDYVPSYAARFHCDKHVVKMCLEAAQMLSTVAGVGYRPTHQNHPCTLWAAHSLSNYRWLWRLCHALGVEYHYRYGKVHKSHILLHEVLPYDIDIPDEGFTYFAQAMPDVYKHTDPIQAYRAYYRGDKMPQIKPFSYTGRELPKWLQS
jgi:hypothetical protein